VVIYLMEATRSGQLLVLDRSRSSNLGFGLNRGIPVFKWTVRQQMKGGGWAQKWY
jgi:hypothetical protein